MGAVSKTLKTTISCLKTRGLIQVGVNAAGSSKKKPSASGWPRAAAGAGAAGGARPVY